MPAAPTAMEATVVRDAPVVGGVMSMSLELQMPGLGTLHADSKAGSVRLTAITSVPVMSLNILQEREHGVEREKEQ